jgi:hypothetical protein
MAKVIARRTLTLEGDPRGELIVTLFQPTRDQRDIRCEFEIGGARGYAMGVDEMQALFLALQAIGNRLYTSAYFKAGKLTWLGRRDLGFPVANGKSDYLRAEDF